MQQRQFPRHNVRWSVEIRSDKQTFTAKTRDISVAGCCVETDFALEEDKSFNVLVLVVVDGVEDRTAPQIKAGAKVVWCAEQDNGGYAAGLEFHSMSPDHLNWLTSALASTQS